MKGNKADWSDVNGAGRIKRMRGFTPRYLRLFSRKKNKKITDFQKFLLEWRQYTIDFLHREYWKPVEESNKNYSAIVGNLWQKICNMTGMMTAEYASDNNYDIVSYELFVIMERVCQHQNFIAYLGYKHMCTTFIMNFNMYDISDSNHQGKISWCQGAMIAAIKYANRPSMSLQICAHIADLLLVKLTGIKESDIFNNESKENGNNDKKTDKDLASIKVPTTWNECCKSKFLLGLCISIDCTESVKSIKDIKGKDGGKDLIKKLSNICIGIFTRVENSALDSVIEEGYKLLSRIDIMDASIHDKVLKQMQSDQRKKYNRQFGKTRIERFTSKGGKNNTGSPRKGGGGSKVKQYGAESPSVNKPYQQKYRIGQLGASVAMNKIKRGVSVRHYII